MESDTLKKKRITFFPLDIDERRLSNRTRISERFSGRFSKRQSGTSSEIRAKKRSVDRQSNRIDHPQIKSPRVALSDVSRLLQNSQTINVRMVSRKLPRDLYLRACH